VGVDLEEGEAQGAGAAGMKFGSSDFVSRLRAMGGSPTELRDRTEQKGEEGQEGEKGKEEQETQKTLE
jgi:hypothetical protein